MLVEPGKGQAVLHGAVVNYTQTSTPGGPRRVLKQTNTIEGQVYTWDLVTG